MNAYLPGGALLNQSAPHFPGVSVSSFSFDPANGDITEHTVEPVVRCTGGSDPNPYPADSTNCPDFTTTGVQVHTFITDRGDGTRSLVVQRFESTDGGTHQIDALFDQEFAHQGHDGGLRFPWVDSAYRRYDVGNTVVPPPAGPGSMLAKFDRTATDGTVAGSQGAETWAAAPDSILFLVGTDPSVTIPSEIETGYHRTVGPSAPTWFGWAFGLGTTPAAVQSAAHDAEVSFTPRVAVSAPADGSSTTDEVAHVTGTSSDDSGDAVAVSVNGTLATVGAGGAWSVDVPLTLGANTLTATATNRYGATSTAQATMTRTEPTTPPPGPGPGPTPSPHKFAGATYVGRGVLRLSRSGVVVLAVKCPAVALVKCSGSLSLRAGRPRFGLGSGAFQAAAGKTVKVRIRLTRRARRLLARHTRLTIHVILASSDTGAVAPPKHLTLALKPPR